MHGSVEIIVLPPHPSVSTVRPQLSHDKSVGAGWQSEDYVIIVGMSHHSSSTVSVSQKRGQTHMV